MITTIIIIMGSAIAYVVTIYNAYSVGHRKGSTEILNLLQDNSDYLKWFVLQKDFKTLKKGAFVQCKGLSRDTYFPAGMHLREADRKEIMKVTANQK